MTSATATRLLGLWLCSAAAYAQISRFEHIVIVIQENRTPDNLFQGLCRPSAAAPQPCSVTPNSSQYNIQTTKWLNKKSRSGVTLPLAVPLANSYDLSHSHTAFLEMCDIDSATGICRMDGAANIACGPEPCLSRPQFRYVENWNGALQPYLDIARQYGWANYMFQTNQGPSFPAHQFLFGGTSAPSAGDDAAGTFASENPDNSGCAAPAGSTVDLITADGLENKKVYPCFEHQTLPDLLAGSLTWRYYAPGAGALWTAPNSISHLCQSTGPGGECAGQDWINSVDLTPADVLRDIAACQLRSVSWVIPSGQNSDHAGGNDGGGPSWVASIVNAIGGSSSCDQNEGYWKNTAILIVWDDWGGWYDHEPPTILNPPEGDYQYGFRVPFLAVSAYTPPGYIDNVRHDFGSILRFIESNFSLPPGGLNFADARAQTDLSGFFDLTGSAREFQPISAPKDANFFLNDSRAQTAPDDE